MSRVSLPLGIAISLLLVRLIGAQCVTTSYVPCLPAGGGSGGSGSVPVDDFDNSEYWDLLGNLANDPIGKRAASRPLLASRQNALCCKPTNQCLVITDGDIPFCYVSTTLYLPFLLSFLFFYLGDSPQKLRFLNPSQRATLHTKAKEPGLRFNPICLLGRQLWLPQ